MTVQLFGLKILIMVSNGVDEAAMSAVQRALTKTGAVIKTVGTEPGLVNSWNNNAWGLYFPVDEQIGQTLGSDFDVLIVPSGARGVQKLAQNPHAERIISSFVTAQKPMTFMGDAVNLLASIELAKGWKVSGPETSKEIMVKAGAEWQSDAITVHNILMTGIAEDASTFIDAMAEFFESHMASDVKNDIKAAA